MLRWDPCELTGNRLSMRRMQWNSMDLLSAAGKLMCNQSWRTSRPKQQSCRPCAALVVLLPAHPFNSVRHASLSCKAAHAAWRLSFECLSLKMQRAAAFVASWHHVGRCGSDRLLACISKSALACCCMYTYTLHLLCVTMLCCASTITVIWCSRIDLERSVKAVCNQDGLLGRARQGGHANAHLDGAPDFVCFGTPYQLLSCVK
jgi:hypothetical protein